MRYSLPPERAVKWETPRPPPDSNRLERRLYRALDQLNVRYHPQKAFGVYTVDAWVPGLALAVEADGCYWHYCATCGWADEPDAPSRAQRTTRRDRRLLDGFGILTVHIPGHALLTDEQALTTVKAALAPYWEGIDYADSTIDPRQPASADDAARGGR